MSDFPTTRLSLLLRVRDHSDYAAWSEFVTLYRPAIYRFARQRGLQEADAQDLAQAVLAAVAQKIEDWEPDADRARFRTWLSQIARNQTITAYRRLCADKAKGLAAHGGTSMVRQMNQQAEDSEEALELQTQYRRQVFRHAARMVRQEFEETTWQAFWITAIDQVSVADAAKSLGQSCGSIYTARSRVIRRLQEAVRVLIDDEDSLSTSLMSEISE